MDVYSDLDPYKILNVSKDSSFLDIKKSYKKLCLKFHPDKTKNKNDIKNTDIFREIQFSYSILSDPIKKKEYDDLGFLSSIQNLFDWKDYFDSINKKITIEMIEEDKLKYQHSEEEKNDIISNFIYLKGHFTKVFETIPHLEFTEFEEDRVFKIIENEFLDSKFRSMCDNEILNKWSDYCKNRKKKIKNLLKKLENESKQSEILKKKLFKDKKIESESDLKQIILNNAKSKYDSMIESIESKYSNKKRSKTFSEGKNSKKRKFEISHKKK